MLDEFEHILAHHPEHFIGTQVLEHVPAQAFVRNARLLLIAYGIRIHPYLSFREGRVLNYAIPVAGVFLFLQLLVVEHLHKEDVGHLLQYGDWVGNACHKEGVPYLIYLVFDFSCNHIVMFLNLRQR